MAETSPTRLYLGNLPRETTKADIESHFGSHGHGRITEVKLMNGFGFIEYEDAQDARDVVPAFHGREFLGERMTVQFARGSRRRDDAPAFERSIPRPRRTVFRMTVSGLPPETSWQDLKDFARQSGVDVIYTEVSRDRDGKGFVEYESRADLEKAIENLNGLDYKGSGKISCVIDDQPERPRERFARSRSPRGRYPPPRDDYYGYDRAPRDYNGYPPRDPPRDDYYRRRTPPPRDYAPAYGESERYGRPRSPRRGPPLDDYGPPQRGRYDNGYGPPQSRYDDEYGPPSRGGRPTYGGPPSPGRRRTPPPAAYEPRRY